MGTIKIPNFKFQTPNLSLWKEDRWKIHILRLDLIHPIISGNKWFKLKYNIAEALNRNCSSLLTFGGAYSNHLVATAAAAKEVGLNSIGIVRGHHAKENYTSTLRDCEAMGMKLHFISREEYKKKYEQDWLSELSQKFPGTYIIPEGGNNELGMKGAEEIARFISADYTHVVVSVGSGTTFAGLRSGLPEHIKLLGFVPMKNGRYLADKLKLKKGNWELIDDYHFGGFGKWNEELLHFMNEFYQQHAVPLDMVYTGKMMYGMQKLLQQDFFPADANILCIHTGGLQGNESVKEQLCF